MNAIILANYDQNNEMLAKEHEELGDIFYTCHKFLLCQEIFMTESHDCTLHNDRVFFLFLTHHQQTESTEKAKNTTTLKTMKLGYSYYFCMVLFRYCCYGND